MQIQITGCMFENMGRNMNTKSKVIVLPCEATTKNEFIHL